MQLEIIPLDAHLQAELFFPTRAFGFVRPGEQVRILFPNQKFGAHPGSVTQVSHTILAGNGSRRGKEYFFHSASRLAFCK